QAVQLQGGGAQVLQVVTDPGQGQRRQGGRHQLGGGERARFQGDVVVHELAEVGVEGRDVAVAGGRAGVDDGPAERLEPGRGGGGLGEQVGRVALEGGEQEVEVLEGGRAGDREPQVDAGGAAGQVALCLADLLGRWNCSM